MALKVGGVTVTGTQTLDATKLTGTVPNGSITLDANEIPSLPASKITSGTFDNARLSSGSVTQYVDLSNLNASNLTSGSIPSARVASGAVTQHVSATTNTAGSWSPAYGNWGVNTHSARYLKVGRMVHISLYGNRTSNIATSSPIYIAGLPFTSWNSGTVTGGGHMNCKDLANGQIHWWVGANSSRMYLRGASDNTITTNNYNANQRGHDASYIDYFVLNGTYITAS